VPFSHFFFLLSLLFSAFLALVVLGLKKCHAPYVYLRGKREKRGRKKREKRGKRGREKRERKKREKKFYRQDLFYQRDHIKTIRNIVINIQNLFPINFSILKTYPCRALNKAEREGWKEREEVFKNKREEDKKSAKKERKESKEREERYLLYF
jgi:hypothetical protein